MVRSRWGVLAAYALLAGGTQVLWVTYAPVTDDAAKHYGVSKTAVGWLAQVFPLVYVVLAIPAGLLLDRTLRGGLLLGAGLTAVGGLLRLVEDDFGWALIGQIVVSLGQPFVLNAITGLTARYLVEKDRSTGIAVGSAATFTGLVVGFLLGAVLNGTSHIRALVLVTALLALAAAVVIAIALCVRPGGEVAVLEAGHDLAQTGLAAFRSAWQDAYLRRLCAVVAVPFGTFIALTTFAQPLLKPAGVSESAAGLMLVVNVIAGVVGCAVVPVWADRHRREVAVMTIGIATTAAACVLLAAAPGVATGFVALAVVGISLLPALPIVLALTEERATEAEGTAAGLVWMAGNLGGLVVATVVGVLVDHSTTSFLVLAAVTLCALPLLARFARLS
jgi:predicted MFS family arabinose efflux permease